MINKKLVLITLIFPFIYGCIESEKTKNSEREDWILWTANWNPNGEQISVGGTQDTLRLFSANKFKLVKNYLPLQRDDNQNQMASHQK